VNGVTVGDLVRAAVIAVLTVACGTLMVVVWA
jgi:hypothetical protein